MATTLDFLIHMSDRVGQEILDALAAKFGIHCTSRRTVDWRGDVRWTLDACDGRGQRWIIHHDKLLRAVCELAVQLECDLHELWTGFDCDLTLRP